MSKCDKMNVGMLKTRILDYSNNIYLYFVNLELENSVDKVSKVGGIVYSIKGTYHQFLKFNRDLCLSNFD